MMTARYLLMAALVAALSVSAAAQDGGTGSPFSLGAGARELSLGSASVAVTSFVTAPVWNPSRLTVAEQLSVGAFHSRLYDSDVAYQYLGLVIPTMDFGSFGVGVFRLGVSGIEERDANNVLLGHTEDNRLAVYLAYGRSMSGYDIGISTTMEYHSLGDFTATSSPGLNLAVSKRFVASAEWLGDITVAANGRNLLSPTLVLDQTEVRYPTVFDAALSLAILPKPSWEHQLTLSARIWKSELLEPKTAFGLEYSVIGTMHLRGGINDNRPALGVGLSWSGIEFDYALVDRDMGSLHMFSFTSSFGTPISARRQLRVKQREEEFNHLMSERLLQQNRSLVEKLVRRGREAMASEDWLTASSVFDRALFLAHGNDVDTIDIAALKWEVENRLHTWECTNRLAILLDSAAVKVMAQDYLAARYFASLAAEEFPDSDSAAALLVQAETNLNRLAAEQEYITARLGEVDSLVSYGDLDRALALATTLGETAPHHDGVRLTVRRVRFERWRHLATTAFAESDLSTVAASLDSMNLIFPDNRWCQEFRDRLRREHKTQEAAVEAASSTESRPQPLSDKMKGEVESLYEDAQKAFESGQFDQAIELWESIERMAPDFQSVRDHLVNAYRFVGIELYGGNQLAEAVAAWERAIQLRPDQAEILNYLNRARSELTKLRQLSYEQ